MTKFRFSDVPHFPSFSTVSAKSRQEGFHKADMRLAGRTPKRDGFARFRSQDRASSEIASHDDVKQLWQPQTALCGTGKDPTESQIMLKGGR
jgi:hypothetical protein